MYKQVNYSPPPMSQTFPDLVLPNGLQEIVSKAVAKDPGDRYQSMNELRQDLEKIADPISITGAGNVNFANSWSSVGQAVDLQQVDMDAVAQPMPGVSIAPGTVSQQTRVNVSLTRITDLIAQFKRSHWFGVALGAMAVLAVVFVFSLLGS